FAGHLGGLIGGAGMAWFLDDQEQTLASQRRTGVWKSAAALGLVLTVAAFAMIGLRMRGELAGLQTGQQARMRQGGQRQLTDRFIFWRRNLRAAMAAMALTPGTGAENKTPAAPEKPATAVAEYKDLLARAIQLLEKTEDPDPESAAIRAKVLSLLHTHGEAVSRQTNAEGMVPSLASQGELVAVKKRYDAWVARMESELKIPRMETNTERGAEETAPDQGPRQEKNNRPQ
ncbi:MAG: hypothetical protein ACKV2V_25305, partial [Blastocatellia bacterium]